MALVLDHGCTHGTTAPPVRVPPTGPTGPSAGASTVRLPTSTITPTWEKQSVAPIHNSSFPPATPPTDTVPADAITKLQVTTAEIADETPALIEVRHCETNAVVRNGVLSNLVVRGNRVIDPATNDTPVFSFSADQLPWSVWDKPFFFFRVIISGQTVDTQKDFAAHETECLRVKYWIQCVAESTTLSGVLPECNNVQSIANGVTGVQSAVQNLSTPCTQLAWYTSLIRNAYVVHLASHGNCMNRTTGRGITQVLGDPPPVDVPNPADWRGITHVCTTPYIAYGDSDIAAAATTPSCPAVLFYGSCCLTGFESSFADAMIARGCRNLILFRVSIPDSEAPVLARDFWTAWAAEKLDPAKIPDCFFRYAGDHYDNMRPVLYGPGGGRAQGSGGLSGGAIAGIVIGAIVGAALIGVGIWALATQPWN